MRGVTHGVTHGELNAINDMNAVMNAVMTGIWTVFTVGVCMNACRPDTHDMNAVTIGIGALCTGQSRLSVLGAMRWATCCRELRPNNWILCSLTGQSRQSA